MKKSVGKDLQSDYPPFSNSRRVCACVAQRCPEEVGDAGALNKTSSALDRRKHFLHFIPQVYSVVDLTDSVCVSYMCVVLL